MDPVDKSLVLQHLKRVKNGKGEGVIHTYTVERGIPPRLPGWSGHIAYGCRPCSLLHELLPSKIHAEQKLRVIIHCMLRNEGQNIEYCRSVDSRALWPPWLPLRRQPLKVLPCTWSGFLEPPRPRGRCQALSSQGPSPDDMGQGNKLDRMKRQLNNGCHTNDGVHEGQ